MQRLAESYSGRVTVLTLDADTNLETVTAFDVRALPTVLVFDHGTLVARQSGAQSLATYTTLLDGLLAARGAGQAPQAIAATTPAPAALPTDSPAMREARAGCVFAFALTGRDDAARLLRSLGFKPRGAVPKLAGGRSYTLFSRTGDARHV